MFLFELKVGDKFKITDKRNEYSEDVFVVKEQEDPASVGNNENSYCINQSTKQLVCVYNGTIVCKL